MQNCSGQLTTDDDRIGINVRVKRYKGIRYKRIVCAPFFIGLWFIVGATGLVKSHSQWLEKTNDHDQ